MDRESIDASLGLSFSLPLFERYRKNGQLEAELHHVPGIRGRCKGYLHLVEGKVVSCHLEDRDGRRRAVGKELLIRLDDERGPFEWTLLPLPSPPMPGSPAIASPIMLHGIVPFSPVPRRVASLPLERLEGWTDSQRTMLSMVYDSIDGLQDMEELKNSVPLPANVVEEALRMLLALRVIVFQT